MVVPLALVYTPAGKDTRDTALKGDAMATTVITGSASGIGAAIRARFEQAGDTVIGIDVRDAEILADLSTRDGREAAIASVKGRCDGLDRFIACAGLATDVRPPSLIASVNYFGAIELLDGLFGLLQRGNDPRAVLMLSNSAQWLMNHHTRMR